MRIIAWNCNMAFRKKAELLLEYNPDILVISECENPGALKFPAPTRQPDSVIWHGDKPHKGLGIFAYNGYKLKLLPVHEPAFQTILPLVVKRERKSFNLFAVWANNPSDKKNQYVGQVWQAIHRYDAIIKNTRTIFAGDFNSNTIWDKPKRIGNHSDVVRVLSEKKIKSTYHHHHKQVQGKEEHPSFYLYRHLDKPYHLDYCFASNDLLKKMTHVEIGTHKQWCAYSDHTPLLVDFEI
ncbi:MAG: endonuclease/exonuclease/phosphatase family protein [Bacteroidetes bacterium]|nr:endonuclease/exonuclease/phosphatase family protein [Bacteroidota bacterium]